MHKMVHNIFNMRAAITYVPYQDLENKQMLRDLLDSPNDFVNHIRRYSNSLTTQMVFGFRTTSNADPKLRQLFDCFEKWGALAAGASSQLSDLYPILRRLPPVLRPNYRYAEDFHKKEMELYFGHWMETKKGLENGSGTVSKLAEITLALSPINVARCSLASATTSSAFKILRKCRTNKLHTSPARSSKLEAILPLLFSSASCKLCSFILTFNAAHRTNLIKWWEKRVSHILTMQKSCHTSALSSRSVFGGCPRLLWRRHMR